MQLRMWMLDIAREQSPTLDHLYQYAALTQDSGYDAIGLYLEHRFAYPSTPWSHGRGCVTPDMVKNMRSEFPSLQVIPFINILGHFEGMIYTEEGKKFREETFKGLQACPCNDEFVELAGAMIDDTIAAFDSQIIHIGGDETWQLGVCDKCKAVVEAADGDGKAELYGRHFGPLAQRVVDAGRTPAIWGDMFLDHLEALDHIPKSTLIFDWQYFNGLGDSTSKFTERGFEVVGCPTLHVYNAPWMHIEESEKNVREVSADVHELDLYGMCVTTWECGLLGAYDTLFPAIKSCGGIINNPSASGFLDAYSVESDAHAEWARLMSTELAACGGIFAADGHRDKLKSRVLMYSNPFLAWMHHGVELSGPVGDAALTIVERASHVAPGEAEKGVCIAVRGLIEFVRLAEDARLLYAAGEPEKAMSPLTATRTVFDTMMRAAKRSHSRIGGSMADIERCKRACDHVDRVIVRLRDYGRGQLGYLPAWEIITHPKFMPHDQACWWLVNKWGNE